MKRIFIRVVTQTFRSDFIKAKALSYVVVMTFVLSIIPMRVMANNVGGSVSNVGAGKLGLSISAGLFMRDIEFEKSKANGVYSESKNELTSFRPFTLKIQYGIIERIDIFLQGGVADLRLDVPDFTSTMNLSGGGGAQFLVLNSLKAGPDVSINIEFSYIYGDDTIRVSGEYQDINVHYFEYQGGLSFFKQISNFIPYAGIKFSEIWLSRLNAKRESGDKFETKFTTKGLPIGLYAGFDYFVSPRFYIHNEFHNFEEDSLILGIGLVF